MLTAAGIVLVAAMAGPDMIWQPLTHWFIETCRQLRSFRRWCSVPSWISDNDDDVMLSILMVAGLLCYRHCCTVSPSLYWTCCRCQTSAGQNAVDVTVPGQTSAHRWQNIDNSYCVLMCIVWGRSPSFHHHHQLVWNRTEPWRPLQVVSTLRQT